MKPSLPPAADVTRSPASTQEGAAPATQTRRPRLRINLRGILLAFVWTAVWGSGWATSDWFTDGYEDSFASRAKHVALCTLLVLPPAAAVGGVVGRHLLGIACGLASAASLTIWILLQE